MKEGDSERWSGLETVSTFDVGNGSTVEQDDAVPMEFCRPSSLLVESLVGQLCKLIEPDQKEQKQLYDIICKQLHQMKLIDESYRIEGFESLRSSYQKALYQLVTAAKNSCRSQDKAMLPKTNQQVCLKNNLIAWSRYLSEYKELGFIARGGFGEVFKAQHKLDGEVYAVKKVYLRYSAPAYLDSVAEVKFIAKLNHPNIVTYKAAWLEPIDASARNPHIIDDISNVIAESSNEQKSSSGGVVFESSDVNNAQADLNDNYALVKKSPNGTLAAWNSSSVTNHCRDSSSSVDSLSLATKNLEDLELKREEAFVDSSRGADTTNEMISSLFPDDLSPPRHPIAHDTLIPLIKHCLFILCGGIRHILFLHGFSFPRGDGQQPEPLQESDSFQWACLYIQMQLCDLTLRQWLDRRNHMFEPVKERDSLALFKKILQGVNYIHSQGVVHHDIKPSNIFVSNDLQQVQVGDFGLACSLLTHNPEVAIIPSSHAHRGQVGTKLYAAPEQLSGVCTSKSDIYSLGILLMELIQPFQTDMERSKVIGQLKSGKIPLELSNSFPTSVIAISRCICHSPQKRPTAEELLELLDDEDRSSSAKIIAEKDETIKRLNREALDREREITELKRQLSELSGSSSE